MPSTDFDLLPFHLLRLWTHWDCDLLVPGKMTVDHASLSEIDGQPLSGVDHLQS